MEDDYEPAVQHQRRVNPNIHDVIKKEVEKLLDAGFIDLPQISDSLGVCQYTVYKERRNDHSKTNDDNELVPTRLVTGGRVADYPQVERQATRKTISLLTLNGSNA
ncbi:hypothetical protein Tco_0733759 [Tanacetum coccineum]